LHVCFYDILICLVGDFDFFPFLFLGIHLLCLSLELYIGIMGGISFRLMDNFSQDLTFSFTKSSATLQSFLRSIFLCEPCFFFLRLSIGGWGFFFFQVHISFPSFGDCSYYDYGMLIVSICLINLLFSLRTKFPRIFLFHLLFISVPFLSWVYLGRKERKIGWGSK